MKLADLESRIKKFIKRTAVAGAIGLSVLSFANKAEAADPTFTEFPVCTEVNGQEWPDVDGRYIVWYDRRGTYIDVYAYDMGPDEIFGTGDDLGKIRVTDDSWDQFTPAVHDYVHDYNGEAFITYSDGRFGDSDVRLVRIIGGIVVSDILIAGGSKPQGGSDIYIDSNGNRTIVWTQADGNYWDENPDNNDYNIYKSVNGGAPQVVSNAINDQTNPSIGSDGVSIVIAWEDSRNDVVSSDIYASVDGVERRVTNYWGANPFVDGEFIAYDVARYGVYVYNWKTEEVKRLDNNGSNNREWVGGISKDWVVTRHTINSDLYIYNILSGKRFLVTDYPSGQFYPAINVNDSALNVVYEDDRNDPLNDRDIYISTSTNYKNLPLSGLSGLIILGTSLLGLGSRKLNNINKEKERYCLTKRILKDKFPNY